MLVVGVVELLATLDRLVQILLIFSSMIGVVTGKGAVKKIIDIFIHKQRDLSIGMKTKNVQHVLRINISI